MQRMIAVVLFFAGLYAQADEINNEIVRTIYMTNQIRKDLKAGKDVTAQVQSLKEKYMPIREEYTRRSPGYAMDVEEFLYLAQTNQPLQVMTLKPDIRMPEKTKTAAFACQQAIARKSLFSQDDVAGWDSFNNLVSSVTDSGMFLFSDNGFAFVEKEEARKKGCYSDAYYRGEERYAYDVREPDFFGRPQFARNTISRWLPPVSRHLVARDYSMREIHCALPEMKAYSQQAIDKLNEIIAYEIKSLSKDFATYNKLAARELRGSDQQRQSRREYLGALDTCAKVGSPVINEAIQQARKDFEIKDDRAPAAPAQSADSGTATR